jgi:protein NrfC
MNHQKARNRKISRRDFIKVTGAIVLVAGTGGCTRLATDESPTPTDTPGPEPLLVTADEIPPADGYLLVDIEKCQGCASCMLACSLIHEGVEGLSLSRIQIMQDSFASFPDDLSIEPCRQCVDPACVKGCPTGALKADARYGNVRMVDKETCIGCCVAVCPVGAIMFTKEIPKQDGDRGYKVDLRDQNWGRLGYPTS